MNMTMKLKRSYLRTEETPLSYMKRTFAVCCSCCYIDNEAESLFGVMMKACKETIPQVQKTNKK